ncbi:hypothetical protein QQG55_13435 [Brugia pahangi]
MDNLRYRKSISQCSVEHFNLSKASLLPSLKANKANLCADESHLSVSGKDTKGRSKISNEYMLFIAYGIYEMKLGFI